MNGATYSKVFMLVCYASTPFIESVLQDKVDKGLVISYAYILHNADRYDTDIKNKDTGAIVHEQGEIEQEHTHIFLRLNNKRKLLEIRNWFTQKSNGSVIANCLADKIQHSVRGAIEYLTHTSKDCIGSKYKHVYSNEELHTYNLDPGNLTEDTSFDNSYEIIKDMIDNNLSTRELVSKYGKDFIYHYNNFKAIADLIKEEEYVYAELHFNPLAIDKEYEKELF